METAVTIDTDLLNKAMQTAAGQTQRQLVEDALRLFALQNRQGEARKYRGKLRWEGSLDEMRAGVFSFPRLPLIEFIPPAS
jgi:Arc/MetJ family transcription regulator